MYEDTNYNYKQQMLQEHIENEMDQARGLALKKLSQLVHFKEIEKIAKIIAFASIEEYEHAVTLTNDLDLSKMDFYAILEKYDLFKELYLKEQENEIAQNF